MDLGQKIEKLLKLTSMTKVELARKLGLKDSSVISHWVKNRFKPDRKNLQKLSATFKKPLSYFDEDLQESTSGGNSFEIREGTSTAKSLYELISSLPSSKHIGVALKIKHEFFDLPYTFHYEEFLPVMFDAKDKETFALEISSKAACPWAEKGEYALFVPAGSVENSKIALIRYKNRYCIKKLTSEGENIILSTPKKQIKVSQKEIIIVAKLMALYRRPN